LKVDVLSVAIDAPGLPDWQAAREVLAGRAAWDRSRLRQASAPAVVRNEWPPFVKASLRAGLEALDGAGLHASDVPSVFASCGGDGVALHRVCERVACATPDVDATLFRDSLHDAPAAYWHAALSAAAASTSVCAFEGTFAAGLVEAAAQAIVGGTPVLLVACDLPHPPPLSSLWNVTLPFAAAMVVAPRSGRGHAQIGVELSDVHVDSDWPEAVGAELRMNPAAAGLPLLALLARGEAGRAVLPGHADNAVIVELLKES
jgi:hypothetical protein